MFKRKLKLIKVVKVDIPAYIIHNNEKFPEYRCTECGFSVADGDVYCSCCGNELDWNIDKNQGEYIEFRSIIGDLEKNGTKFKQAYIPPHTIHSNQSFSTHRCLECGSGFDKWCTHCPSCGREL